MKGKKGSRTVKGRFTIVSAQDKKGIDRVLATVQEIVVKNKRARVGRLAFDAALVDAATPDGCGGRVIRL